MNVSRRGQTLSIWEKKTKTNQQKNHMYNHNVTEDSKFLDFMYGSLSTSVLYLRHVNQPSRRKKDY